MKKLPLIIVNVLILGFVGRYLVANLAQIDYAEVYFRWGMVLLSLIFPIVFWFNQSFFSYYINRILCLGLTFGEASGLFLNSLLSTYIPGKIFIVFKRRLLLQRKDVSSAQLVSVFFLETVGSIIGSILFFYVMIASLLHVMPPRYHVQVALLGIISLLVFHPRAIRVFFWLYQKVRGGLVVLPENMRYRDFLVLIVFNFLNWFVYSAGVILFLKSFMPVAPENYFYIIGLNTLAGLLGMAAFFTPSGLGVREGVLAAGLGAVMSGPQAAFCAVVLRVWATSSEIASVIVFNLLKRTLSKA